MNIIPKWLIKKHQPKEAKQAVTPAVVGQTTKEVIDCIVTGIENLKLIRKPEPEIKSAIHGGSIALNKNGNFTAIRFKDVLFECSLEIMSEIHVKYQLGATDEGQAVTVIAFDEMPSLLAIINKSIVEYYPKIKTSDSVEIATKKLGVMLNNELRLVLQGYFEKQKRLIDAVVNYKTVNYVESVNVTETSISNFLSKKGMKNHGRVYADLLNDKPPDISFKPVEQALRKEPSIDDIMGDE